MLDASVAASWFLEEDDHPHVGLAWDRVRTEPAVVPSIWWYEIRNVLLVAERRKRLVPEDVERAWQRLRSLRVTVDPVPDDRLSLTLARKHGLTIYDSTYVELAKRLGHPLATRDLAMINAARAEGVSLIGEDVR